MQINGNRHGRQVGSAAESMGRRYRRLIRPLLLRHVYADMRIMECTIRATDLVWTLIRAHKLVDTPAQGSYRIVDGHNPLGGWTLSRADLADFTVDQITDPAWKRRSPPWPTDRSRQAGNR